MRTSFTVIIGQRHNYTVVISLTGNITIDWKYGWRIIGFVGSG